MAVYSDIGTECKPEPKASTDSYNGPNWKCPKCGESYYGWRGDSNICDSCQCDLVAKETRDAKTLLKMTKGKIR